MGVPNELYEALRQREMELQKRVMDLECLNKTLETHCLQLLDIISKQSEPSPGQPSPHTGIPMNVPIQIVTGVGMYNPRGLQKLEMYTDGK